MQAPKRYLHYFTLVFLLMIFAFPLRAIADTTTYPYQVTFKAPDGDVVVDFATADEHLSDASNRNTPVDPGSSYSKKYFLGWSDVINYEGTDAAHMYYGSEPVSRIVDENIHELYPVYLSAISAGSYFDDNMIFIDKDMTDAEIAPGAELSANFDTDGSDHNLALVYDANKDRYDLKFNATFKMNRTLAHWLYTGNGATIMTNTQDGDKANAAVGARYTHVDLNVTIPEEVEVPEKLTLSFKGYYFQPYMAIDTKTREKFAIEGLSGDSWNITPLVSNTDPTTTFTILNPTRSRNITLRTIVRTNSGYGGKSISGINAETIASDAMTLTAADNLYIPKAEAEKLLTTDATSVVSGYIDGYVVLPQGTIFGFPFNFSRAIQKLEAANPVNISFHPLMVSFNKNSANLGDSAEQKLGSSRVVKNGSLANDVLNTGTKPSAVVVGDTMADDPANFEAGGITYVFSAWNTQADGHGDAFTADSVVTSDMTAYAVYVPQMLVLNQIPALTVKDATIKQGDELDLMSLVVSATDAEDGDLKDQIQLVNEGAFDKDVPGEYTVTFKVVDAKGASATKTAKVTVLMKWADMNAAPVLTVKDATIKEGEDLDLTTLVVSAEDAEDGDLTDKVELVDKGGFDNNKSAEYTITFKVVDSQGAYATKTAKVVVLAKETPQDETVKPDDNNKPSNKVEKKSTAAVKKQVLPKTSDIVAPFAIFAVAAAGAGFIAVSRLKKHGSK